MLSIYWTFNVYLILTNYTTIEFCEKRMGHVTLKSQYTKGPLSNIREALGPIKLLLIPISRSYLGFRNKQEDGVSFKTNAKTVE